MCWEQASPNIELLCSSLFCSTELGQELLCACTQLLPDSSWRFQLFGSELPWLFPFAKQGLHSFGRAPSCSPNLVFGKI